VNDFSGVTTDLATARQEFQRDGYVVLRGFLTAAQAAAINVRIDDIVERAPTLENLGAFYEEPGVASSIMRLQNLEAHDEALRDFYFGDQLRQLAGDLLDTPATPRSLQWFGKPPRIGKVTPPHQDGFYYQLEPSEALTMWLSLDNVDAGNGCVRYLPGSHHVPWRPHSLSAVLGFSRGITDYGAADYASEQPMTTAPGDMIIHHCDVVHRADANTSDRQRRALGMVFYAERAKSIPGDGTGEHVAATAALQKKWKAEGRA
jgi:phytanoyl-CoA hydroxylase